ncbi:MAG: hypothetical protein A3C30_02160 [Candidatus Levybacteria bacterium RIFCSPHIGHO2_02_FULL_40_18]|nr:MAG: hypothetical protein A2869_04540 [Candidatus Levybacteria bacterium RIFCSPHIGHO2_01_FULL_40_58]OGH26793.1 MAG: hypothetical protein A3C30_02160 [Candidatus Levybacteria bacterium RIFCSPHIGHO2_02_FULL_40_18]OGH31728.1 MAG: hypothetical protein A3E43_01880 [Candidatus Levybacteria bacterium RIFCSPHIGHO2_12_FULL_40_31]OGH40628.1 MAG: hypothetical protein A2894_00430 [Candidatus Levybacteria bacterium RIFCSPLOWO2_01_FULL_40_64]OGH48800.1 MAG: hypothetical protein A3I54_04055 [Candidatus Lev
MKKNFLFLISQFSITKGFTLMELLTAMGILGILASGLIIAINPVEQFKKNRDAQRKNDFAQLQRALETYYNDYGRYPPSSGSPNYRINASDCGGSPCQWGGSFGPYMNKLPKDPVSTQTYRYVVSDSNGQSYRVYASLERKNLDLQVCNPDGNPATDDPCANVPVGVTCGTATNVCNYGASSSNVSP